jgi:YhcG PDDEXK nuclease domain
MRAGHDAFVGSQYHLEVGGEDFYVDLLFYHLKLRSFVVIELKAGSFKPEFVGQLNFYASVVDDQLRHASDAPTIGILLCRDQNQTVAEYALRDVNKPLGVSSYDLLQSLPKELEGVLPSVEQLEAELSAMTEDA